METMNAPRIEPGRGRLRYDKARRTIVAEKPDGVTLYWDHAGPLLRYANGVLHIEDLNPEMRTKWVMSRGEMFRLGWRFIWASMR